MTNTDRSTAAFEPRVADYITAAQEVIATLLVRMSAKKERAARLEIERYISRLETFGDQRLPLNVVPLRSRTYDTDVTRLERQRLAAAVRQIAAPVLS